VIKDNAKIKSKHKKISILTWYQN